ncbi:MAG: DsbA family protein [Dehalococcoidia bacterium]|nr:DsbA family protein [Dehalococcoidia bacterium]
MLEYAKAAQAAGPEIFQRFHEAIYDAIHRDKRKLELADVKNIALDAGLDVAKVEAERDRWNQAVEDDHHEARRDWQVFGVPTLIVDGQHAFYLKLNELPPTREMEVDLFDRVFSLSRDYPEVMEIKRPMYRPRNADEDANR